MATLINSSLVPEREVDDSLSGPNIIMEPIPENVSWPQWVNNKWQEYSSDDDPMVIQSKQLEESYTKN